MWIDPPDPNILSYEKNLCGTGALLQPVKMICILLIVYHLTGRSNEYFNELHKLNDII